VSLDLGICGNHPSEERMKKYTKNKIQTKNLSGLEGSGLRYGQRGTKITQTTRRERAINVR